MAKNKKSIQEKVEKDFPEFAEESRTLSVDQLNNKLATLAKGLEESETAKENDTDLENAQALVAELSAPYKDVKKAIRFKTKYIISLLGDKGAL
jgi:DNA-binding ferritin-like protein